MSYNYPDDAGYGQSDADYYEYHSPTQTQYDDAQARVPSIFRAQQQPGFDNEAYMDVPNSPAPHPGFRLSTITERTERTEPSTLWHPRQQYTVPDSPRSLLSSVTTSYGKEIDREPAESVTSYTPAIAPGRKSPDESHSTTPRVSVHEPTPPLQSEASSGFGTARPKSESKLSRLASSKASSISSRSESTRSTGSSATGTMKTYPALRPSARSDRPPSSVVSSKALPDLPVEYAGTYESDTSSIVRRAINAAMELEGMDNGPTPQSSRAGYVIESAHSGRTKTPLSDRSKTPTPDDIPKPISPPESKVETPPQPQAPSRPLSKLAMLAQKKQKPESPKPESVERPVSLPSAASSLSATPSRPLSKLALLAQQKVDATRMPKLPKTTTEYLTPIANGSSVTTAITTSYQSLYSLTDPTRPNTLPKLDVVPLTGSPGSPASGSASQQKPSKLAMKIRRANEKSSTIVHPTDTAPDTPVSPPPLSPLFQPSGASDRASPSAFASILVHDVLLPPSSSSPPSEEDDRTGRTSKRSSTKAEKDKEKKKRSSSSSKRPSAAGGPAGEKEKKKRKPKHILPPSSAALSPASSAFDGPSPDDIVLNARKRSTVGGKPVVSSPKTPLTPTKAS